MFTFCIHKLQVDETCARVVSGKFHNWSAYGNLFEQTRVL